MKANVQCLPPALLHKIRHALLVWRHDNNLPIKRIRPERVSFLIYSDDPDTSAYMVGQNIPLPTETIEQIPLTPTASAAVDNKDTATFNVRAMDDNDEIWATKADHRTGWNKTFKSGTYRVMLYGIVLRDFPKQIVSLTTAKSVPTNIREFLSCAQRHYRIDVVQVDVKSFLTKARTRIPPG